MSTNDSIPGVQRPLTPAETDRLMAGIAEATSTAQLLTNTIRALYNALLADTGHTVDDFHAGKRLDPGNCAIPRSQWQALVAAITDRAAQWGTAATLALELVNLMPGFYDDPTVPAPTLPKVDYRPEVHQLHVTRDATDVIAACDAHIHELGTYYGRQSRIYLDALDSWHHQLAQLFSMELGAHTRISADGRLSLLVSTGSGIVFGVIFHGALRRCTADGCAATIRDDGSAYPRYSGAPMAAHDHTPSYPLGAPQPGRWSFHS